MREGELDDKEIELTLQAPKAGVEIMAPPGMEEMTSQLQSMFSNLSPNTSKPQRMSVKAALKQLQEEEGARLIDDDQLRQATVEAAKLAIISFNILLPACGEFGNKIKLVFVDSPID